MPRTWTLPRTLRVCALSAVAFGDCGPSSSVIDAASDVVSDTSVESGAIDGATCAHSMPGRVCFTSCGTPPGPGQTGLQFTPCELYCDTFTTMCFDGNGAATACNVSGDGDGGRYVFC